SAVFLEFVFTAIVFSIIAYIPQFLLGNISISDVLLCHILAQRPANAVVIGGGLAAVATVPMTTGWYVIGATPARLYAPERDPSFFVGADDLIRFEPVDAATFDALRAREAAGEPGRAAGAAVRAGLAAAGGDRRAGRPS
ncbi:allophanate hydrolase subunit 1, partial [Methylobacterium sp. J-026]|uniref:carboxyltransferase domain-containing protein n=1 Tax=Methylobacterium sp. J-026 TaxID=2836624 RepID=UPI001FB86B2C